MPWLLALAGSAAMAGEKHEHGAARLDIAIDGPNVIVSLDTPLANLLGFEHAPGNPVQQRAADTAITRLRDAAALFRFDPAARCRPAGIELRSPALKLGPPAEVPAGEHADLEGDYSFTCERAPKQLEQTLFDAFVRLQRLDVQLVTGTRQSGTSLQRPVARLPL